MPVPNLDVMGIEGLSQFSERHEYGKGFKLLFPPTHAMAGADTAHLSRFATAKCGEKFCKAQGDIPHAMVFKQLAEGFYAKLSPAARWRKP
jgi:hypothetical protein